MEVAGGACVIPEAAGGVGGLVVSTEGVVDSVIPELEQPTINTKTMLTTFFVPVFISPLLVV